MSAAKCSDWHTHMWCPAMKKSRCRMRNSFLLRLGDAHMWCPKMKFRDVCGRTRSLSILQVWCPKTELCPILCPKLVPENEISRCLRPNAYFKHPQAMVPENRALKAQIQFLRVGCRNGAPHGAPDGVLHGAPDGAPEWVCPPPA